MWDFNGQDKPRKEVPNRSNLFDVVHVTPIAFVMQTFIPKKNIITLSIGHWLIKQGIFILFKRLAKSR
jgi:hypothetical protein